jgi:hypothetical protein
VQRFIELERLAAERASNFGHQKTLALASATPNQRSVILAIKMCEEPISIRR